MTAMPCPAPPKLGPRTTEGGVRLESGRRRLARDPRLPRGVRALLWLLLAYPALPVGSVPVLGYADDAILVAVMLRAVARKAGPDAVARPPARHARRG